MPPLLQQTGCLILRPSCPHLCSSHSRKQVKETQKIWHDKDVNITATCIRVPVMRAHAESINLEFESPLSEEVGTGVGEYGVGVGDWGSRHSREVVGVAMRWRPHPWCICMWPLEEAVEIPALRPDSTPLDWSPHLHPHPTPSPSRDS